MTNTTETIKSKALSLPLEDRARLVVQLLDSLDSRPYDDPKQIEYAWLEEGNRRYQAFLNGEEDALPAEQVFSEL